jgi:hypothetical protein
VINTGQRNPLFHELRLSTCYSSLTLLDEDVDIETTPPGYAEPLRINVHNKELRVSRSVVIAIPVQHEWNSYRRLHRCCVILAANNQRKATNCRNNHKVCAVSGTGKLRIGIGVQVACAAQ